MVTRFTSQADAPILDLLDTRWSPRAFSDRSVERNILHTLFEAARWSPSSSNLQPWYFIVAQHDANPEAYKKILGNLKEGNQSWAQTAPVLVIAITDTQRKPGVENRHAFYDVGTAIANLTAQATSMDLYLRQMGGIHIDKIKDEYQLPPHFEPVVAFALGYLAEDARPGERSRKPLRSFVFDGKWDTPYFE